MSDREEKMKIRMIIREDRERRPYGRVTTIVRKLQAGLAANNVQVPCNGCNACCREPQLYVDLDPGEEEKYQHQPTYDEDDGRPWDLKKNERGECMYLLDGKCSIYHDRPRACRTYDCRLHLLGAPLSKGHDLILEALDQWELPRCESREDRIWALVFRLAYVVNPDDWERLFEKVGEIIDYSDSLPPEMQEQHARRFAEHVDAMTPEMQEQFLSYVAGLVSGPK
jgi:Fe-S-cluster containining protein